MATKHRNKSARDGFSAFTNPRRKWFTRDDIQDMIRGLMFAAPQAGCKPLSKREQEENAMHERIAKYFDPPEFSDGF